MSARRTREAGGLFAAAGLDRDAPRPLADKLRPKHLSEVVGQDDLVGPDGQCAGGRQEQAPDPNLPAGGGISLQMTECDVVNRIGTPDRVDLGSNERGERAAVLTYTRGARPGVYRFAGGRLVSIERGAEAAPERPKKAATPQKKP